MTTLDEHARAGMAAMQEQRFEDAIRSFQAAIDVAPDRPDMNHALAMAYMHRGDVGNAIEPLQRAVKLSEPFDAPEHQPLKRDFHLSLATAHQLVDQIDEARSVLRTTIAKWPDGKEARIQLAHLNLAIGDIDEALNTLKDAYSLLSDEDRKAAEAIVGSIELFNDSEYDAFLFLEAHAGSYLQYFNEVSASQVQQGWYAEAARMAQKNGELVPMVPEDARPYALQRADLVNPKNGEVASIYSEQEPMIVTVEGLEPLAQLPVLLEWPGYSFPILISTRCPWHWLSVTIQFEEPKSDEALVDQVDEVIGSWYLDGYNGKWGDKETGRFHYVTDPELVGDRGVSYTFDLGRAGVDAIRDLMRRLDIVHGRTPIRKVVIGQGKIA